VASSNGCVQMLHSRREASIASEEEDEEDAGRWRLAEDMLTSHSPGELADDVGTWKVVSLFSSEENTKKQVNLQPQSMMSAGHLTQPGYLIISRQKFGAT
jgi:hypothetical protein